MGHYRGFLGVSFVSDGTESFPLLLTGAVFAAIGVMLCTPSGLAGRGHSPPRPLPTSFLDGAHYSWSGILFTGTRVISQAVVDSPSLVAGVVNSEGLKRTY